MTILPVGRKHDFDAMGMVQFFPLIGILLGMVLAFCDQLFLMLWSKPSVALLDVTLLVILTGALHLDGLGDSADGLFSHRSREKVLKIMKDSRIGVMGLVAVVLVLALKWVGIWGIESKRCLLLVLVPAYSRASLVFAIKYFDYGRPEDGIGRLVFDSPLNLSAFWGTLALVALSAFLGWRAVWLNVCFVGLVLAVFLFYKSRLNAITGDMLGALEEVTEAGLFFLISAKFPT
jgi:adenosylcobinamide-GDP ribazoletransferase